MNTTNKKPILEVEVIGTLEYYFDTKCPNLEYYYRILLKHAATNALYEVLDDLIITKL